MAFPLIRQVVLLATLACAPLVHAAPLAVGADDTIVSQLQAHKGKKVTLRLLSGDELSGTVAMVGKNVIHLSEVTGREFFDAVVQTSSVQAILVRTK
jgi:hypothetical protein